MSSEYYLYLLKKLEKFYFRFYSVINPNVQKFIMDIKLFDTCRFDTRNI